MASCNLDNFENKIEKLNQIRKIYNKFIGEISVTNNSNHLYRIRVSNNKEFCAKMLKAGIMCGIHYETLHNHDKYRDICVNDVGCDFVKSIFDSKTVASIPFHDNMSYSEAEYVVKSAIALSN
jgi:dTDP-4-amino-4,6-dideoxygalactose transaminase